MRHLLTVTAMTVTGIGGGALVGWVNIPHAGASSAGVEVPVVAAPQVAAPVSAVQAEWRNVAASRTVASPPRPAAPVAHHVAAPVQAPAHAAVPDKQAVDTALTTRSQKPAASSLASSDPCGAALAYLRANSAPGFSFECPGYALGHQAMTCVNVAGVCPGQRLIVISTVCQASYMNEAHNSWVVAGYRTGTIDPYGYCH